tara:strand:+ start:239 stop:460 length:222 start_codon:yes stop_codon:yes gene_type:complete
MAHSKSKRKYTMSGRRRNIGWKAKTNKIIKKARASQMQRTRQVKKTASSNPAGTLLAGVALGGAIMYGFYRMV